MLHPSQLKYIFLTPASSLPPVDFSQPIDHAIEFVPRITGQPFVGTFTGQRNLEAFVMDFSGKQHQRRTRRVGHRRFRRNEKPLVIRNDLVRSAGDHERICVEMLRDDGRLRCFVELADREFGR